MSDGGPRVRGVDRAHDRPYGWRCFMRRVRSYGREIPGLRGATSRGVAQRSPGIFQNVPRHARTSSAQNEPNSEESLTALDSSRGCARCPRRIGCRCARMCQGRSRPHEMCGTNAIPGNLTKTARFHRMPRECRTSFGSFLDFRSPYDRPATMARLATRAPSRPAHPIASLVTFSTRFTDNLFEGRAADLYILPLPIRRALKARFS